VKLVRLVCFITKKFVMIHGHKNLKYEIIVCLLYYCQCLRQKNNRARCSSVVLLSYCFLLVLLSTVTQGFYFNVAWSTAFIIPKTFMNRPSREQLRCPDSDETDARHVNSAWGEEDLQLFVLLEYGVASGDIYIRPFRATHWFSWTF
jgi:hypothetical protein